jgi:hypothetical protein
MTSVRIILTVNGQQAVAPGGIALAEYEERAMRCAACEQFSDAERPRCALMPDTMPWRLGLAINASHPSAPCPVGKWADMFAPTAPMPDSMKPATITQTVAHGAAGLVKAALGLDRCDDATLEARRATCATCEHLQDGRCGLCGCLLAAKQRLAGERCPAGKWQATAQARRS